MIRVLINGSKGKMGAQSVLAVQEDTELELVAAIDREDNLEQEIKTHRPEVVLDFTTPHVVEENIRCALSLSCHIVVGTTGLDDAQLQALNTLAQEQKRALLVCPNFAIGAVLMMKFAAEAARYIPCLEVIERHHDKKLDAPSGTALKTIDMIVESQSNPNPTPLNETELVPGSRGGLYKNVRVHSVRLPGYVASQEVVLGDEGQTFSLQHHTIHRGCFMPGVVLALKKAQDHIGLVYGLEHLL